MTSKNQKEPDAKASGSFYNLAQNCNVRCLRSFRTFFNNEFNLLAFGQIFETVTLNGREMDKHVRSAFALDEAEAFVTIEPFYCTSYTIRHFLPPLAIEKKFRHFVIPSEGKTKQLTVNRELLMFFKPT
jgi:hypothetical protein